MKPITIAILGFDGVAGLDLVGPLEAFAVAEADGRKCYDTCVVGLTLRPFAAESGVTFRPHASLEERIDIDTLVVPARTRIATTSDKQARCLLAFKTRAANSPHRLCLHWNLRTGSNWFA
jgi:transcriptional regulator GlxA family with amidase domain